MSVTLQDFVEIEGTPRDWLHYIHPQDGDLVTLTDEDLDPEWGNHSYFWSPKYFEDRGYIKVPDLFGDKRWRLMERFAHERLAHCGGLEIGLIKNNADAEAFRKLAVQAGLGAEWVYFLLPVLHGIARKWLEENGIPYNRSEEEVAETD